MRVLSVASELYPLIKTGGLADVAGALPGALRPLGVEIRTLVPGYPAVLAGLTTTDGTVDLGAMMGGPTRLILGRAGELELVVLDAQHLYGRPGNPYLGPDGRDWADNHRRYGLLGRVAADIGLGRLPDWRPDLVHGHDWQAGLAPAYLEFAGEPRPATVLTIHNLAFQGLFDPTAIGELGLPPEAFQVAGYEAWGRVGFLKAGLYYADRLTTVSPTYAREIQTEAEGMGLHGLLRARSHHLLGIANGIDDTVWDPAADAKSGGTLRFGTGEGGGQSAGRPGAVRPRHRSGRPPLHRRQPPHRAEGAGPAPARPAGAARPWRPARPAGLRRAKPGIGFRGRGTGQRRPGRLRVRL